jgi:hypothetical protein
MQRAERVTDFADPREQLIRALPQSFRARPQGTFFCRVQAMAHPMRLGPLTIASQPGRDRLQHISSLTDSAGG